MAETIQNQKVREAYELQITKSIDAIYASRAYTEMKKLFDEGLIEFEEFNRWLTDFNEKAFFTAEKFASTLALMDINKDEKSDLEKQILQLQKDKEEIEKDKLEARLIKEQEILECQKEKLCIEKEILQEQRVNKSILLAKEILAKDAAIGTEIKRGFLIDRQRIGFSDNLIIQRLQTINESIGMIQSGGNEAPAAMWGEQAAATGQIASISGR